MEARLTTAPPPVALKTGNVCFMAYAYPLTLTPRICGSIGHKVTDHACVKDLRGKHQVRTLSH